MSVVTYSSELSKFIYILENIIRIKTELTNNFPLHEESRRKRWYYKLRSDHADRQLKYWTERVREWKPMRASSAKIKYKDRSEEIWVMTGEAAYSYGYDRQKFYLVMLLVSFH